MPRIDPTPVPYALDLDGVLWLAERPIPGAAAAVARLHDAGHPIVFVTNNSYSTVAATEAKLVEHGIRADIAEGAVVSSAVAAATLITPGDRVMVCGGPGVHEAVIGRGAVVVDGDGEGDGVAPPDVVIVGFHWEFDYERMRVAATAVRRGARLVATNEDATYPTPAGPIPGAGAILAGIVTAAGVAPDAVAGKPHRPIVDLVRDRYGDRGVVVGDRPDTDGRFAVALGWRFALVLSGVTTAATSRWSRPPT